MLVLRRAKSPLIGPLFGSKCFSYCWGVWGKRLDARLDRQCELLKKWIERQTGLDKGSTCG